MGSILGYSFMQRALLAGILISATCSVLGILLVLRKDAMLGHGISHATFGGVALGLYLNIMPLTAALIIAILCAIGIIKLKEKAALYEDTAIGILSSVGMAMGIILTSLAGSFNVGLMSYLFGNILAISRAEVWISLIIAAVTFSILIIFYKELFFITFDPESAKASGIKVDRLEGILVLLTAIVIVLGMKIVGLLLVTALIVIPAAAGLQVAKSLHHAMVVSVLVACISLVLGLLAAFSINLPASGSIILFCALSFILLFSFRVIKKRYCRAA